MTVRVRVLADVRAADIPALKPEQRRAAAEAMVGVAKDPYIGKELRDRYNLKGLKGCRRVAFDVGAPSMERPCLRLVYRLLPFEGAPEVAEVISIGPRADLDAYRRAVERIRREHRA